MGVVHPHADNPQMPASNVGKTSLLKAKFLHLKSWINNREPPDQTELTYTRYTHRRLWAGYKKQNDKYMPFVRNMLIMKHVHHLSSEMEGKNPTICLNAYL